MKLSMQRNRGKQQNGLKTRDLFKKIRDTKGIFHAKMGTIKDKNGMDLTEAEDINPVAIRRGEGAQMKWCRDPRCRPSHELSASNTPDCWEPST